MTIEKKFYDQSPQKSVEVGKGGGGGVGGGGGWGRVEECISLLYFNLIPSQFIQSRC